MKIAHYTQIEKQPVTAEGAKGAEIRWLVSEKDGAPNFALRMFELEPNGQTPYHKHPWEHEVFCLEGEGILIFEGNEYPFKAYDSIFVDPDKMHQFKNVGAGKLVFLCIIPHESKYSKPSAEPVKPKTPVNPFAAGKANNC